MNTRLYTNLTQTPDSADVEEWGGEWERKDMQIEWENVNKEIWGVGVFFEMLDAN